MNMSDQKPLACIILAAGHGKRMNSSRPKVLHEIAGRPLIGWLLEQVSLLRPEKIIAVTAPGASAVEQAVKPHETAIQETPRGTGDAVRAAMPLLSGFTGDVLILMGDMPFIAAETLRALIAERYKDSKTGLAVLGAEFETPPPYGRLLLDGGAVSQIVEDRDCTPAQRAIRLCNIGAFCVDGIKLPDWLAQIDNANAQNEFYITDLVEIAAKEGVRTHAFITRNHDEVRGVNSRADLAALEKIAQKKLRARAMENGATLTDPESVHFSWDTILGRDALVEPGVFFGPGVRIADHVHIKAYSYLEGASIEQGAAIGPFARLRPGASIGSACKIGNFVEIKNASLGKGVKAGHLAYIGDADIGDDVNFSCGAITVNYDGFEKHRTIVGAGAMVGSNVNLVAPLEIGEDAYIAAGSTITKNVPAGALAIAREKGILHEGWSSARKKKKTGHRQTNP